MRKANFTEAGIAVNKSYEAISIERELERVTQNNEPIENTAPIIYTERKEGVQPQYNIRTDRFDIAIDAMDKIDKTYKAQREQRQKEREEKQVIKDNKIEPVQAT